MELVASDVGACKDTGWPGLPCAGHSWSQLTPIPRAQLSCKFINKIYFININPQPQWSSLRDSWIKGRQHCLVVKGKKWGTALRASNIGTGRAGDAGIPLQLTVKVLGWKFSLKACGWDHIRTNPPIASMEGPHRNIFIPAAIGRVPCWVKRKVWGGRSSKEGLRSDLKILSKLPREGGDGGMRELRWAMRKGRCLDLVFFLTV